MDAFCDICGERYDMRNPEIRRVGSQWECADEAACFGRLAAQHLERDDTTAILAAMQRGLDAAWTALEEHSGTNDR